MANRRTRIIYASQSVTAEGRILYRVQTFGSTSTFNTTDYFELGALNLTDVVEDSPAVAVALDTLDYGSVYTMATLAKVPTENLNHNIRQSDGVTFFGNIGAFGDVSNGDLTASQFDGLPASSGTGKANIAVKNGDTVVRYLHGVQLIDYARECGISKGVDIWAAIQGECSLGSTAAEIEMTKLLKDVFVNSITLTYNSTDTSTENYAAETEQKQWLLNSARFLSWEEFRIGKGTGELAYDTFKGKGYLQMSLKTPSKVATLTNGNLAFLKSDEVARPAVHFTFVKGGGLTFPESKAVPVFDKDLCTPSSVLEYFLYNSASNRLEYYKNGAAATLADALPVGRSDYQTGDKVTVFYAADSYAVETGGTGRPAGADATYVCARYFAPISSDDNESVGALRQGQVEVYLVDPDLVLATELTGATITGSGITFSDTIGSNTDLTKYVGLKLKVIDGPGKNGPVREVVAATNNLSGSYNNGSLKLGGTDFAELRLKEAGESTSGTVFVADLCGIDEDYVGAQVSVKVAGIAEVSHVKAIDTATGKIDLADDEPLTAAPDAGCEVLVKTTPTTASTVVVGDYEMALRLRSATITATLTREGLKELGHLNNYARPVTLPIPFTLAVETTASDLETFATFAGKKGKFIDGTLTNLDIVNLLAKDNMAVVVKIYQQTDAEAGGVGENRKALSAELFGDEYFDNGVRGVYAKVDGSERERPVKCVIAKNIRITDENFNNTMGQNATQTFSFRGTNEVIAIRGDVSVDLVGKEFVSQAD